MLAYSRYLEAVGDEVSRILEIARTIRSADVPTRPGWSVDDLVAHLSVIFRDWTTQLRAADPATHTTAPTAIRENEHSEALEAAVIELVERLGDVGEDAPCWNWSDDDFTARWVARRMALESALHRVDAAIAAGNRDGVATDLSLDGIDEKFDLHLRVDVPLHPTTSLGGTVCLICSDADAAWTVSVDRGRLRVRTARAPASVALVGSASNLFQFVWNRVGPDLFTVTGDREVARRWVDLPS